MRDPIDRQTAIDAILEDLDFDSVKELRAYVSKNKQDDYFYGGILHAINAVQDLSPEQSVARDTNVLSNDTISRQAAIDALMKRDKELRNINWYDKPFAEGECKGIDDALEIINTLPSTQPTLYGYDIKHLMLIANVLQKENLPPERVTEALMDIGRIVSIVRDEFEETLRKSAEQCMI